MVQGTIADQASEFAMPVTIEVKGRKILVRGAEGVWTDSVHNVHIEASTPTVFRFHFEGTDWTFRPDNPLDAHFDLLDPWNEARSSRRGRIHIRKAEPETWSPAAEVAVARAEAGGVEIESIPTPTSGPAYERLPMVSDLASEASESPAHGGELAAFVGSALVASDTSEPDATTLADFHFIEAVRPGADTTTTSNSNNLVDFDVLPPRDTTLPTMLEDTAKDRDESDDPDESTVATRADDDIEGEAVILDQPEGVVVATRETERAEPATHVFIDIDALPKPEARDPFGGEELPTPHHRTLEETLRQDAWRPAEPPAHVPDVQDNSTWVRLGSMASATLRAVGTGSRACLTLLWRFAVWLWTVARPAMVSLMRRLATTLAPTAKRVRSLVLGVPAAPAVMPGEVAEGKGPKMCTDVHAWSISAHGPFRVARCIYCEDVRMDSEQSQAPAMPEMRRRTNGSISSETDRPLSMLGDR